MDLKAYEKRRVRELYQRITKNLNSRRRYAERKGRSFTPDQEAIRKRFYCYYLLDTLDRFYLRDLAFLRDPNCWDKQEGFCDISFPESSERGELLRSSELRPLSHFRRLGSSQTRPEARGRFHPPPNVVRRSKMRPDAFRLSQTLLYRKYAQTLSCGSTRS